MGERLSGVDAAWYRIDRPENTADVLGLLEFRHVPRLDELRQLLEERLLAYPRFRQRVETASDGVRWEDAPGFDLDRHLVQLQISSVRDLRGVVSSVASERLDPDRPLWRFHLVDGPEGGALIAKIHHCIADGFALVSLLLALADERPAHAGHRHRLPASRLLDPWSDPGAPRGALRAVEMVKRAGAFTAALARMTALPADPSTLLRRSPAGRRRVAWSRGFSLESVRRAARARQATVNDLLMAALAGAIRAWLTAAGDPADADLRALVPVNLRPWAPAAGDVSLGNRFGLVFVSLPIATATAAGRLEAIQSQMAAAKGAARRRSRLPDPDGARPSALARAARDALLHAQGVARGDERPRSGSARPSRRLPRRARHVLGASPRDARGGREHPELRGRGPRGHPLRRRGARGTGRPGGRLRGGGGGSRSVSLRGNHFGRSRG